MIHVLIVEDDDDIRDGLKLLIDGTNGYACAGAYRDCETALANLENDLPDVALMDIELPGMSGIEGVRQIRRKLADIDIIMLTNYHDDQKVFDSLCAGATGYLVKTTPPAKLLDAIKEADEGGAPLSANIARMVIHSFQRTPDTQLTKRESEILSQLCKGKSYKMIADTLFISTGTVHSHIKNIYNKLEVNSKSEAVIKALQEKLV